MSEREIPQRVRNEFWSDYTKSKHYRPGDEYANLHAWTNARYGYSIIELWIYRPDENGELDTLILPFYLNPSPYEADEGTQSDSEQIEDDEVEFIDVMSGATEWTEWMNDTDFNA